MTGSSDNGCVANSLAYSSRHVEKKCRNDVKVVQPIASHSTWPPILSFGCVARCSKKQRMPFKAACVQWVLSCWFFQLLESVDNLSHNAWAAGHSCMASAQPATQVVYLLNWTWIILLLPSLAVTVALGQGGKEVVPITFLVAISLRSKSNFKAWFLISALPCFAFKDVRRQDSNALDSRVCSFQGSATLGT